jgi:hypothetical protein
VAKSAIMSKTGVMSETIMSKTVIMPKSDVMCKTDFMFKTDVMSADLIIRDYRHALRVWWHRPCTIDQECQAFCYALWLPCDGKAEARCLLYRQ